MKYLPDSPYECLTYFSQELLDIGRENMIDALFNNKLKAIARSGGTRQLVANGCIKLSEISKIIKVPVENFNEIKIEILPPCPDLERAYLSRVRFNDIIPTEFDYRDNNVWGTSLYHTDYNFAYNNYKLIIYLNDVVENGGGTVITDPIILPKLVDSEQHLFSNKSKIKADEITFREIIGPAGTCVVMNSHVVHRASLPVGKKYRAAMHLSFTLNEDRYYYREYNKKEYYR